MRRTVLVWVQPFLRTNRRLSTVCTLSSGRLHGLSWNGCGGSSPLLHGLHRRLAAQRWLRQLVVGRCWRIESGFLANALYYPQNRVWAPEVRQPSWAARYSSHNGIDVTPLRRNPMCTRAWWGSTTRASRVLRPSSLRSSEASSNSAAAFQSIPAALAKPRYLATASLEMFRLRAIRSCERPPWDLGQGDCPMTRQSSHSHRQLIECNQFIGWMICKGLDSSFAPSINPSRKQPCP